MVELILGQRLKKRIKVHFGSDEHVRADLKMYGLTDNTIPVEIKGQVVLDHSKWLAERRRLGK
jgi:spore coat protein CotH